MLLADYNRLAEEYRGLPQYRGAAVSVHGMNTRGAWQKEIQTAMQDRLIRYRSVDYGLLRAAVLRRRTAELVATKICEAYVDHERLGLRCGAIAHSFGTLALGRCLQIFPDVRLCRVVLFGSILPPDYEWDHIYENGQIEMVLNETSRTDLWSRFAKYAIPDSGPSGVEGFRPTRPFVIDRHHPWTAHGKLGNEIHCRHSWIPFLMGEQVVASS